MAIVLYALKCISDGLAGSQRSLVGHLVGLVRYLYVRIYVSGRPGAPHMLSNRAPLRSRRMAIVLYALKCISDVLVTTL